MPAERGDIGGVYCRDEHVITECFVERFKLHVESDSEYIEEISVNGSYHFPRVKYSKKTVQSKSGSFSREDFEDSFLISPERRNLLNQKSKMS